MNSTTATAATGLFLFSLMPVASVTAETFPTKKVQIEVETLADGLDSPWAVEALPDGGMIVTERTGQLRIVRDGKTSEPVRGLPTVAVQGQGGLLDVALAQDFAANRTIFLTMSVAGEGGYGTAVVRGELSADEKSLADVKELFRMNRFTTKGQHFGSRIAVAKDGSLFFAIGDRGERERAQDPKDHAGSVLHINADGTIPQSNPHRDSKTALPEIWSFGHRNAQGITFDSADQSLWTVEHGARGGDEVNQPQPDKNYGWPVITYGKDYSGADIGRGTSAQGYEQPAYYWDPSIAPGALAVYRGAMFPEWDGDILVAALKFQLLSRLERDESGKILGEERMLEGEFGRLRDVTVAPDGSVLLLTDGEDGKLLRVSRAASE